MSLSLQESLGRLSLALASKQGRAPAFAPFVPCAGPRIEGKIEVRSSRGEVRQMQRVTLPLPASLLRAFALGAPRQNLPIDMGAHALTLWAPQELLELQVGYRWNGYNGRRIGDWDERFVVFAEDGGDPLALRLDEDDGPVWKSRRAEGRHGFTEAAPSLADFYLALALWIESGEPGRLAAALEERFGAAAEKLWIWRELVSRVDAFL